MISATMSRAGGTSRPRNCIGWRCTWITAKRCWPKQRSIADAAEAVLAALGHYAMPARVADGRELLEQGRVNAALDQVMPSELFCCRATSCRPRTVPPTPMADEIRREAAEAPAAVELRSHFALLRNAQADACELVFAGIAQSSHVSDADGLFQPHHGRELGIESCCITRRWPTSCICRPAELNVLVPDWTRADRGADLRHASGGLAGAAAFAAAGGRRRPRRRRANRWQQRRVYSADLTYNRRQSAAWIVGSRLLHFDLGGLAYSARRLLWLSAQERPTFRVKVDMVVLSFTVTDSKGHYINGLKPSDFRITEDGIAQKINTFGEGNKPPVQVLEDGTTQPLAVAEPCGRATGRRATRPRIARRILSSAPTCSCCSIPATTCTAVLCTPPMRSPISCAAWTAPIRWPSTPSAAIFRAPRRLTHDRNDAIFGLRKAVAGDDAALYNGLLLTLRDAAKVPGRKVIIVFSNGPDNASMVAPDDVRAVAEDEGIPIYVISTNDVNKDPMSSARLQAHLDAHRRQSVFRQDLAEAGGGVRIHSRRSGQQLHHHLLSAAESERRLSQDQCRDRVRRRQEVSRARPSRLSAARRILI